jgi:hypothetical protein
MALLDYIIVGMQLVIIYRLSTSPIWRTNRHAVECLKVIYFSIGTVAVLTICTILAVTMYGLLNGTPKYVYLGALALLTLHSLIAYHVVYTIDTSRILRRLHATRRPGGI